MLKSVMLKSVHIGGCGSTGNDFALLKKYLTTKLHLASKETYHFCRTTLTKIHCIKINNIWTQKKEYLKNTRFSRVKMERTRLNHERSFFENRRNCSPSELHGGSLFRTFNSYSFNFNGGIRKRHTGYCLLRTPQPEGQAVSVIFEN